MEEVYLRPRSSPIPLLPHKCGNWRVQSKGTATKIWFRWLQFSLKNLSLKCFRRWKFKKIYRWLVNEAQKKMKLRIKCYKKFWNGDSWQCNRGFVYRQNVNRLLALSLRPLLWKFKCLRRVAMTSCCIIKRTGPACYSWRRNIMTALWYFRRILWIDLSCVKFSLTSTDLKELAADFYNNRPTQEGTFSWRFRG